MSSVGAIGAGMVSIGPATSVSPATDASGNYHGNDTGKMSFGRTSKVALQIDNLFTDLLLLLLLQMESPKHTHQYAAACYQAAQSMGGTPTPAAALNA
jgi:hypothetical protein